MRLVVRTWNVFHGRTQPETGRTYLQQAISLVSAGEPDVVCLQELPVWSLGRLDEWSGMRAVGAVTMRAVAGRAARRLTALDPARLRSALTGQANAVLLGPRIGVVESRTLHLNPRSVRRRTTRQHGLPYAVRRSWARDRRVAQLLDLDVSSARVTIVNLHLTTSPDSRPADAELLRVAAAVQADERVVLAGDLNLTAPSSRALRALEQEGFSAPCRGLVDHILVRGLELARRPQAWPDERRRLPSGELLSDHDPLEAEMMSG